MERERDRERWRERERDGERWRERERERERMTLRQKTRLAKNKNAKARKHAKGILNRYVIRCEVKWLPFVARTLATVQKANVLTPQMLPFPNRVGHYPWGGERPRHVIRPLLCVTGACAVLKLAKRLTRGNGPRHLSAPVSLTGASSS